MAVSANLRISEELTEAFRAAQDGSTRYLIVRIEAEVLQLAGSHEATESQEEDFGTILGEVPEHEPSFVLFRRDVSGESEERAWTLVSYVPDTSKVRQKMLYASSKKDLLLKLGASLFAEDDFYVGEAADLTFEGFVHATRKATDAERAELLTEAEAAHQAEATESISERGGGGGGAVPFQFDETATEALAAFASGDRRAVEIMIHPKKEVCQLGPMAGDIDDADLEAAIVEDAPRYYLISKDGHKFFVYCCPEDSKVRSRMLYSTCRATVIANANEQGIQFARATEMREPREINDCLVVDQAPAPNQAIKEISRAKRKTRGKRRLNKKITWT